jgi:hypothetical protein
MAPCEGQDNFEANLQGRSRAAKGLERDLLTEVPLLYGSPGRAEPEGDPGIVLAAIHREELIRRNGGGVPPYSNSGTDNALPFERAITVLVFALLLVIFFLD